MDDKNVRIFVKGVDRTKEICLFQEAGNTVFIQYANNPKKYPYHKKNVKIKRSVLSRNTASQSFLYLKKIAAKIGLNSPSGANILLKHCEKIKFIDEKSILAAFLTGEKVQEVNQKNTDFIIYPFGFNISQKKAVDNAIAYSLSIIKGPPGTGKTQTILNIIANALIRNERVAVVSGNNAATKNVLEKLTQYHFNFFSAYLGSVENKKNFLKEQPKIPDLSTWFLDRSQEKTLLNESNTLNKRLGELLWKRNTLSEKKKELDAVMVEYRHFCEYSDVDENTVLTYLKPMTSDAALSLWFKCEKYAEMSQSPSFFAKLYNRFFLGVVNKDFYSLDPENMISLCQKRWYLSKIKELTEETNSLQSDLEKEDFSKNMRRNTNLSLKIFKSVLARRYHNHERKLYHLSDLWKHSTDFIKEYPVILSTTYSLQGCLSFQELYDYVIIDEASQVDLVTGALALSCAKKAVIVGDEKQLSHVVNENMAKATDCIYDEFDLPEAYRYKNHSLLNCFLELFPDAPRVLLREHYRCHPKIIEFCNQKFYDGQLVILTEDKQTSAPPFCVYVTPPGNHERDHMNQRQIDMIEKEIIPSLHLTDNLSVGITTPYRRQTNALQRTFKDTSFQADTVDKFQGREKDIIILSTVDNCISPFSDNSNRLNVAVSRAIKQLIVVTNNDIENQDSNIADLIKYIQYYDIKITPGKTFSVFDYLYKDYQRQRQELLKQERVSEYDSENLMFLLLKDILKSEEFFKYDIAVHVPLKMIIHDMSQLDEQERKYAQHILTHVDFLIFNKFGKNPCLAIEVDGNAFHKEGCRQFQRDRLKDSIFNKCHIPLLRFKTDGSDERLRILAAMRKL